MPYFKEICNIKACTQVIKCTLFFIFLLTQMSCKNNLHDFAFSKICLHDLLLFY